MPNTLTLKSIPDAVYALAIKLDTKLFTMDKKLLRAFPNRAFALTAG
jgi:predicted nucleic acid-binding protein